MTTISDTIATMINEQINAELYSAYLYQEIADFYHGKGLPGFARWFDKQAQEELEHAKKFIDYLRHYGKKVVLQDVKAPQAVLQDIRDGLKLQVEHEGEVTSLIDKIMDQAILEKDYRTQSFLKWFIDEQVEEESHSAELLERYDLYGKDLSLLARLDHELGERK